LVASSDYKNGAFTQHDFNSQKGVDFDGTGIMAGVVSTMEAQYLRESITGNAKGIAAVHDEAAKLISDNKARICKDLPPYKTPPLHTIEGFNQLPFSERSYADLKSLSLAARNAVGKKIIKVIRDSDIPNSSFNAPMKFLPALGFYYRNYFYIKGREDTRVYPTDAKEVGETAVYYGAAGGTLLPTLKQYFGKSLTAYDLEPCPQLSTKHGKRDINYNLAKWERGNILMHQSKGEDVLISDVYLREWGNSKDSDRAKAIFTSNLLQGKIEDGRTSRKFGDHSCIITKAFCPDPENLQHYKDAYPFVAFNTARPMSDEIVLLKSSFWGDFGDFEDRKKEVAAQLGAPFVNRIFLIKSHTDFEWFCRQRTLAALKETIFQVQRLGQCYTTLTVSPYCRKWGLGRGQIPVKWADKRMRQLGGDGGWMYGPAITEILDLEDEWTNDEIMNAYDDEPLEGRDGVVVQPPRRQQIEVQHIELTEEDF